MTADRHGTFRLAKKRSVRAAHCAGQGTSTEQSGKVVGGNGYFPTSIQRVTIGGHPQHTDVLVYVICET
jgi:hypothetical protein